MLNFNAKNTPKMTKLNRVGLVLSVSALVAVGACKEEETVAADHARPVLSMVVADVEAVRLATYPGRAEAVRELNIAFEVSGKVLARPVDVGTQVKAGDILATIDPDPYAARVRALEGQRDALRANLTNAKIELERREQLVLNEHVAQARVDDQVALVKATEANIEATEGQLDEARLNLGHTRLVAPFDGAISATYIEQFQNVIAGQPIVRILDTSRIEMEVAVPENFINLEPFVEGIEVEFSSLPGKKIPARVARVGNEASTTTRTYPVTIVMEQPEGALIQPGMAGRATAQIHLPDGWSDVGIHVPSSAVFSPNTETPDDTYVWVIDPEDLTVTATPVTVNSFNDRGYLVSGLDAGARIAIAGANTLTEGQQVVLADDGE